MTTFLSASSASAGLIVGRRLPLRRVARARSRRCARPVADGFERRSRSAPFELDGERVSSSLVRAALEVGDLERATRLLGRPYRIRDACSAGASSAARSASRRPTRAASQGHPAVGHLCRARARRWLRAHPAVASLGTRPTVDGTEPLLEVHAVRLRRRPLRPASSRRLHCEIAGRDRIRDRSTRSSRRCISTRRRRAAPVCGRPRAP